LSNKWVLTAAHCCYSYWNTDDPADYMSVVIGAHAKDESENTYAIKQAIIHERYEDKTSNNNDFCLGWKIFHFCNKKSMFKNLIFLNIHFPKF